MGDKGMIYFWLGILLGGLFVGTGCYSYFYRREKNLFTKLQQMLDDALNGNFNVSKFSETKQSLFENSFKRYLDNSQISAEEQKKQKEIIQELISDIAHQTLTPVSNLKLYIELLKESYADDERVETVLEETEKLDFFIQSLVKLSRMENGIIAVHPVEQSVYELIEAIQRMYQLRAVQENIIFKIVPFEIKSINKTKMPVAIYDLKWTMEAVGNIIDNAFKYTPTGGSVTVSVQQYSFFIRIDISDTGIGIAEEEIPKVFTRFYRSFDVADMPGVGIGLYLARYIVEVQKGYIKVFSKKGKGSTFSVFLPRAEEIHREDI